MTVREYYDLTVAHLKENGFESSEARVDARILVDHFARTTFAHLVCPEKPMGEHELDANDIEAAISELAQRVPLAYILQKCEFYSLCFQCCNWALIPRPETELLVENAVESLKNCDAPLVADLGTGSGCIAVLIAHELKQSVVYATDLSCDALNLARTNAALHGVQNRIEFVEGQRGEWAQPLIDEGFARHFNCVLTNPPYISSRDIAQLPTQIKDFEPRLALDGGEDGLDCYRQIAAQCGELLASDGFLLAELGAGQFDSVKQIFEASGWQVAPPILDFAGHQRVLRATKEPGV